MDVWVIFNENMSFYKADSLPLSFSSVFLSHSPPRSIPNLALKVSGKPHGVHLKAKGAAGERSSQHSGELRSRKQVLLINSQTKTMP